MLSSARGYALARRVGGDGETMGEGESESARERVERVEWLQLSSAQLCFDSHAFSFSFYCQGSLRCNQSLVPENADLTSVVCPLPKSQLLLHLHHSDLGVLQGPEVKASLGH